MEQDRPNPELPLTPEPTLVPKDPAPLAPLDTIISDVPAPLSPSGLQVRRGPKPKVKLQVLDVSELKLEDLAEMDEHGPDHGAAPVQRLRSTHQAIARYMSAGLKDVEIAQLTGYSPVTLSILKTNPAFQNLLQSYMEQADEVALDLAGKISLAADMALDQLVKFLDVDPNAEGTPFDPEWLRRVADSLLDRAGHGPTSRQQVDLRGVILTGKDLADLKRESDGDQQGTVVQADFKREAAPLEEE